MPTNAERLIALYRGHPNAYGQTVLANSVTRTAKSKISGKSKTVTTCGLTPAVIELHHLAPCFGDHGQRIILGAHALCAPDKAGYTAVDLDLYEGDKPRRVFMAERIKAAGLTKLVIAESKSGGAHAIAFFKEPIPGEKAKKLGERIRALLGFSPNTEVFPKQVEWGSTPEGKPAFGNWLHMAYQATDRMPFCDEDGQCLPIDEGLAYAEARLWTEEEIDAFLATTPEPKVEALPAPMQEKGYQSRKTNLTPDIKDILVKLYPDEGKRHDAAIDLFGMLLGFGMTWQAALEHTTEIQHRAGDTTNDITDAEAQWNKFRSGLPVGGINAFLGHAREDEVMHEAVRTWYYGGKTRGKNVRLDPTALAGIWKSNGFSFFYDEFAQTEHVRFDDGSIGKLEEDAVMLRLRMLVHTGGYPLPSKDLAADTAYSLAYANPVHPLRAYYEKCAAEVADLSLDECSVRVERLLIDYAGAIDTRLARVAGRNILIGIVRRATEDDVKVDEMYSLISAPGRMKSTFLKTLVGSKHFTDKNMIGLDDQKLIERLQSILLAEVAENHGLSAREAEELKAFLSATFDKARKAYGRGVTKVWRRCLFVGTGNKIKFSRDRGGRRVIPIIYRPEFTTDDGISGCKRLEGVLSVLWGCAWRLAQAGVPHWLDTQELRDEAMAAADGAVETTHEIERFDAMLGDMPGRLFFCDAYGILYGKVAGKPAYKVSEALIAAGFEPMRNRVKRPGSKTGAVGTCYVRGTDRFRGPGFTITLEWDGEEGETAEGKPFKIPDREVVGVGYHGEFAANVLYRKGRDEGTWDEAADAVVAQGEVRCWQTGEKIADIGNGRDRASYVEEVSEVSPCGVRGSQGGDTDEA